MGVILIIQSSGYQTQGREKYIELSPNYFLPDYDGDSLIPDWFAGTEALKSVFEISAHTQANNPNGVQKISSSHQLGPILGGTMRNITKGLMILR